MICVAPVGGGGVAEGGWGAFTSDCIKSRLVFFFLSRFMCLRFVKAHEI